LRTTGSAPTSSSARLSWLRCARSPTTLAPWVATPADPEEVVDHDTGGLHIERRDDLFATIADALGIDNLRVLAADDDVPAAQRERWDDLNPVASARSRSSRTG
jgi:arginine deiminase